MLLVPLAEICAVKVGNVLSTVTEALLAAESPVASMAVKVQVTTSVGLTILGVSWSVLPVEPYTVPLELLHAYDTVGVSHRHRWHFQNK